MLKIEELIIPRTATVLETMKKLDETGQRILFIAPEGVLQAVVTDGDIRKFFLRGGTLEAPVEQAANFHPISLPVSERGRAKAELQRHGIDALPILNKRGVITDIVFAGGVDVDNRKRVDIPVVDDGGRPGHAAVSLHQNFAQAADPGRRAAHRRAYHRPFPRLRLPPLHDGRQL